MARTEADCEFAFALKKQALGPYIVQKWGWNEEQQRDFHAERWNSRSFFRVAHDGAPVGTVSIDEEGDHISLSEFYLEPARQRQGIGTEVLKVVLAQASAKSLPVRLGCLRWNPVFSLYARNGFVVTHENEDHYFMERRG